MICSASSETLGPGEIATRSLTVGGSGGSIDVSTSTATLTISGTVSGTGALTKIDVGDLAFSTNNALNSLSAINVNEGDLQVCQITVGFNAPIVTIASGATFTTVGTLSFTPGSSGRIYSIVGAGTWRLRAENTSVTNPDVAFAPAGVGDTQTTLELDANIDTGASTDDRYLVLNSQNNNFEGSNWGDIYITGSLLGAGNITYYGSPDGSQAATLTFEGDDYAWTGNLIIERGEFITYSTVALSSANQVAIVPQGADTAEYRLWGSDNTIGGLTGTGNGDVNSYYTNTLTIVQNGNSTFPGTLENLGSLSLNKEGSGTLTLSGTMSYTGATTVEQGSLIVDQPLSSTNTLTVDPGATFNGSGSVGTAYIYGTISPGVGAPGILNTLGDLDLYGTSTYVVDLAGANVPGSDYSELNVDGAINLNGATLQINLSYSPNPGDTYIIIGNNGVGYANGAFAGLPQGSYITADGQVFQINYYGGGSGSDVTLTDVVPTTTTLMASANPSVYGQAVTFTATVAGSNPTGTVSFQDGTNIIATGIALNANGTATFSTTYLAVGTHQITGVYSGDASNPAGVSSPVAQVVNQDAVAASVASSGSPSIFGSPVTFTAMVGAASPGSGTPTGSVGFYEDGTLLQTVPLSGTGTATYSTSTLAAGNHQITVDYSGDGNFNPGTSPAITQSVTGATLAQPSAV